MLVCKNNKSFERSQIPPAIVLGINPNGNDMLLCLERHEINVYQLDFDRQSALSKLSTENKRKVLLDWLNDFAIKHGTTTLIPSSDEFALLLSSIGDKLDSRCQFLLPNISIIQQCIDKFKFFSLCDELSISAPETHLIEKPSDCDDLDVNFFPCIAKPYDNKKIPNHIISKVRSVNTKAELIELANNILRYDDKFIIQKQIIGDSLDRFFVGGMVAKEEGKSALFIGKKLREIPSLGGTTTHCILEWNDSVFEAFRDFVNKTGYVGLVDFEMMLDKTDNQFKVIEINPRIGAWHLVSRTDKSDIIHYYYCMLNQLNTSSYTPHKEGKIFLRQPAHFCSLTEEHGLGYSLIMAAKDHFNANVVSGLSGSLLKSFRTFLGCAKDCLLRKSKST
jgi:predicted ATP-grasp superfamily ATP-dependent carboligase